MVWSSMSQLSFDWKDPEKKSTAMKSIVIDYSLGFALLRKQYRSRLRSPSLAKPLIPSPAGSVRANCCI